MISPQPLWLLERERAGVAELRCVPGGENPFVDETQKVRRIANVAGNVVTNDAIVCVFPCLGLLQFIERISVVQQRLCLHWFYRRRVFDAIARSLAQSSPMSNGVTGHW